MLCVRYGGFMGQFVDLTGKVFGELTILSRTTNKNRRTRWTALCSCGDTCIVLAEALRSKDEKRLKIKCNKCSRKRLTDDFIGRKFGRLTVISKAPTQHGKPMWSTKCLCGTIYSVSKYRLLDGTAWKCKKCPINDLVGKVFGKWTVLKNDSNSKLRCIAKCSCGTVFKILRSTLTSGSSTQCRKCYSNIENKIPFASWASLTRGAKIRGLHWDSRITREWLWELFLKQNKKCAMTGIDIEFSLRSKGATTASLDRKNNNIGYELNNVHFVHKHINIMKRDFPEDYFIDLCRKVSQNYPRE